MRMREQALTPRQVQVLELLGAFEYLTTREVHYNVGGKTTRRSTEQKLKRLHERGFVARKRLHPERGAVSECIWSLLPKGAHYVGLPVGQYGGETESMITPVQSAVLLLLAQMKQLSTTQLWGHLHDSKSKHYTRLLLYRLRKAGYVHSRRLHPERGAASEHYWALSRRGAAAIGAEYDARHRRVPTRQSIEYRGLLLELRRQVNRAGWSLIGPTDHRGTGARQEGGGQRPQLVEAVLRKEQWSIEALLLQGYPAARLRERIDRCEAGHVGAVVPRVVSEHVAFVPGQPEHTVLLIAHRPLAGKGFWTRKSRRRTSKETGYRKETSRTDKYRRLAEAVIVLAVFEREEAGRHYSDLLAAAGFDWVTVDQVAERLSRLRAGSGSG